MPKASEALRHAAHDAWIQANGDKRIAIKLLRQHPEAAGITRLGRFIATWGPGLQNRDGFKDAARPGQPSHIQQVDLRRAAQILKQGYPFNHVTRAFGSFQHALDESAELRGILESSQVSVAHLLRRIKAHDPTLYFGKQPVKAAFNLKQKADRVRASKKLLRQTDHWRQQVFWVDAKKMYVTATSRMAWLDGSQPVTTISDSRTDGRVALHFYAVVNAKGGPVALKYVTGTSDLQCDVKYQVGTVCCA